MAAALAPTDEAYTAEQLCDPLWVIRNSAQFITLHATHVRIDQESVAAVASHWHKSGLLQSRPPFDRQLHFVRLARRVAPVASQRNSPPLTSPQVDETNPALTVQYLFFVDAMNFCFWPDNEDGAPFGRSGARPVLTLPRSQSRRSSMST